MSYLGPLLHDPLIFEFLGLVGTPYWWLKGTPKTPWSEVRNGIDCSGWVQVCWVRMGLYASHQPDRRATADMGPIKSLANICDPTGSPVFGDIAVYPGHVMLCLGGEWVLGATGGTSITLGNDPKACVKLERFDYRRDFLTFGSLRAEHHRQP